MTAKTISKGDIIVHPVRLRILLTLAGRQMTTQQLRAALPDIAQATLYRHMTRLCEAGIIVVAAETPVRGVIEKIYSVPAEAGMLTPEEFASLSREDHLRYFTIFVGSLIDQFRRYLHQEIIDPVHDGAGYRTAPLYLTDEEYDTLRQDLQTIMAPAIARSPAPNRRRRLLAIISIPDRQNEEELRLET